MLRLDVSLMLKFSNSPHLPSCHCMLPTSHPNSNLLSPFPLNPIKDIRNDLWTQRLLKSLWVNQTNSQLMYCAYYHPFSSLDLGYPTPPFLSTADHYLECQSKFDPNRVIGTVLFVVHPGFFSDVPIVCTLIHPIFKCPALTISWWDIPMALPGQACAWVDKLGKQEHFKEEIWLFK